MENPVIIYVISDAIGETAQHIIRAVTAQFSLQKPADIRRHAFIRDEKALLETLEEAKEADGIVVQTLVQAKLAEYATDFCSNNHIPNIDLLHTLTTAIETKTGLKSKQDPGNMRRLDSN
ncbi:putative phosphotransferase, partial [Listeria seeligeri FSL S4-171]